MIGEKNVKTYVLEPYQGMWISSLVLLPIGIFLTYKATTDSPLLDVEAWRRFFNRLFFARKDRVKP